MILPEGTARLLHFRFFQGPIIERVDNEDEFKQRVALRGVAPSSPHPGKFAILLEPAKDQAIVRACVDGVCVVRVRMVDEGHRVGSASRRSIRCGVASRLENGDSGTARLLWVEPVEDRQDPQIAWTVARIGGSVTAAFAMITSKTGNSPPLALRGCAGHDGRGRRLDAGRPRRGVQQGWDGRPRPSIGMYRPPFDGHLDCRFEPRLCAAGEDCQFPLGVHAEIELNLGDVKS